MSGGPTIVVKFGESVSAADQDLFLVEMDDELNVDSAGEVKSQFFPGDEIFFLMHYDAAKLVVTAVKSTDGQVVVQGQVSRAKTEEMLFMSADDPVELSHSPSGKLTVKWFGRESTLTRSGRRSVIAAATPALGEVSYNFNARSCKLIPPPLTLAADEEYPIAVVIYVEAAV